MGMCRVNGPDALPVKPAGLEKLGHATFNICEAGSLYHNAHPSDFGQRIPTAPKENNPSPRSEVRHGQNTTLDVGTLHYVRHCERLDSHTRTRAEERTRRAKVKARRKLKKHSKKLCKQLGIKYQ